MTSKVDYVDDDELDSILDDALADFDKPVLKKSKPKTNPPSNGNGGSTANKTNQQSNPNNLFDNFFNEEMSAELTKEWEAAMEELSLEDPSLADNIKNLHSAMKASNVPSSSGSTEDSSSLDSVAETMRAALSSMTKDASSADVGKDAMFGNLMGNLLPGSGSSSKPASSNPPEIDEIGMMENLMKTMLSKEMLYPPMKEMSDRYPEWLQKNSSSLSEKDKENYENQLRCLKSICKEYESEPLTEDDKSKRFHKIMGLIDSMQGFGTPPADLIGNNPSPIPSPDQCVIS